MKKIVFLTTLIYSSLAYADAYNMFAGLEYSTNEAKWSNNSNGVALDTYGVKVGIENRVSRVYVIADYMDTNPPSGIDETIYEATFNLDAKGEQYDIGLKTNVFVGAQIGLIHYKLETAVLNDINEIALIYGAHIGLLSELTSSTSMEIGYKYSFSELEFKGVALDNIQTYYGAINFHF